MDNDDFGRHARYSWYPKWWTEPLEFGATLFFEWWKNESTMNKSTAQLGKPSDDPKNMFEPASVLGIAQISKSIIAIACYSHRIWPQNIKFVRVRKKLTFLAICWASPIWIMEFPPANNDLLIQIIRAFHHVWPSKANVARWKHRWRVSDSNLESPESKSHRFMGGNIKGRENHWLVGGLNPSEKY